MIQLNLNDIQSPAMFPMLCTGSITNYTGDHLSRFTVIHLVSLLLKVRDRRNKRPKHKKHIKLIFTFTYITNFYCAFYFFMCI